MSEQEKYPALHTLAEAERFAITLAQIKAEARALAEEQDALSVAAAMQMEATARAESAEKALEEARGELAQIRCQLRTTDARDLPLTNVDMVQTLQKALEEARRERDAWRGTAECRQRCIESDAEKLSTAAADMERAREALHAAVDGYAHTLVRLRDKGRLGSINTNTACTIVSEERLHALLAPPTAAPEPER